ncbi:MAG: SelB C-terminal domain-containing protein, partial [Rubrivivax sp.]|nr:SelB C-terminal domain-containing protein [Rubrivivax sp.]
RPQSHLQLHLHLGNAVRAARLVLLDGNGHAQLLLDRPMSALRGDRFVLRDPAAQRLLGGGTVLDAFAPARGRATPRRLAELEALAAPAPAAALAALLALRPEGVKWPAFAANWNLPADAGSALAAATASVALPHAQGLRLLAAPAWQALLAAIPRVLADSHAHETASRGLTDAALHEALAALADRPLHRAALDALQREGRIERDGFVWRCPGHVARLTEADAALLQRVTALLQADGLRPPPPGEIAPLLDLPLPQTLAFLQRAATLGHLVQIAKNRFFLPATLQALVQVARETAAAAPDGRFEVIPFRDRSGIGRNLSIQVLEYFDRVRITRFVNERRSMADTPEYLRG